MTSDREPRPRREHDHLARGRFIVRLVNRRVLMNRSTRFSEGWSRSSNNTAHADYRA